MKKKCTNVVNTPTNLVEIEISLRFAVDFVCHKSLRAIASSPKPAEENVEEKTNNTTGLKLLVLILFLFSCSSNTLPTNRSPNDASIAPDASIALDAPDIGNFSSCEFNDTTLAHGQSRTLFRNPFVGSNQSCESQIRSCNDGKLTGSYTSPTCQVRPLPTDVLGRLGGWVRLDEGFALTALVCLRTNSDIVSLLKHDGVSIPHTLTSSTDAPWLDFIRDSYPDDCAGGLQSLTLFPEAGPQRGQYQLFVDSTQGEIEIAPVYVRPRGTLRPLEGLTLINHDAWAFTTRPHTVPPRSEASPGAATSPVDLPPSTIINLFKNEVRDTLSVGGAMSLSMTYGQTPLFRTLASPWSEHVEYWKARDPNCAQFPESCFRDNYAKLFNETNTDIVDIYSNAVGNTPLVLSFRLNDRHHVIAPDAEATSPRHAIANPPFLEGGYRKGNTSTCITHLTDAQTFEWKVQQFVDLIRRPELSKLSVLEVDLVRDFCFAPPGISSAEAIRSLVARVRAELDIYAPNAAIILRLPRDVSSGEIERQLGDLSRLKSAGVKGWILGRVVSARNDPLNDEFSLHRTLKDLLDESDGLWFDVFQFDRHAGGVNLPASFERLISDTASAYGRGASGASLFNFQYYAQHFSRSGGLERVTPPYDWSECMRRRECVGATGRHYAGRIRRNTSWVVDYSPPDPGGEMTFLSVHAKANLREIELSAFREASISFTNIADGSQGMLGQNAIPNPFRDRLGVAGGIHGPMLFNDPNSRSVIISEPAKGLNRFVFQCGDACSLIGNIELFSTTKRYAF